MGYSLSDDPDMVFVERNLRTPSPDSQRLRTSVGDTPTITSNKRRSVSVGDKELKMMMAGSPNGNMEETPTKAGDTTMNGILSDFKGELSSLDPTPTLDLVVPSTPSRPVLSPRLKTDGFIYDKRSESRGSPTSSRRSSTVPPTPILQVPDNSEPSSPSAMIPPRFSSLQSTPSRSSPVPRPGGSPLRTRNTAPFYIPQNQRGLRILHRSAASSSEPSLIPVNNEQRLCKFDYFHVFYCLISINSPWTSKLSAGFNRHRFDSVAFHLPGSCEWQSGRIG